MAVLKCKMCGGDLNITGNEKVVECEYCGSKQTVFDASSDKKINLFNRANRLRMSSEFDKAGTIYEQIIGEFPEEAEAYWCLCLCNYGIEYVDDPATAEKKPTCHRASFEKMRKDPNYELALENASMEARIVYEEQAKEIDRIMSEILSVSREEKPYDIFICYKETDNYGKRTPDSVLAQDIYDALTQKDYRTFFARITLEDKLGTQYEPYIFSALNSAKIMLVVGTDYEHLNSVWVKNEWSRFVKLMAKDKTKILIPCYKDMDPYDLPDEIKSFQSQDCSKLGFMQDLTRGIDKLLGKQEQHSTVDNAVNVAIPHENKTVVEPLLERVFIFLEDGKWQDANIYCEKVLDIDPKNAEAYLGKLMAELQVKTRKQLADCKEPFDNNDNFAKVIRFGDEVLEKEMQGYITNINDRKEEAEKLEEKQINQTVEAVKVAFEKRISEKNYVSIKDKEAKIQSKITELTSLSTVFDEKQAEFKAVEVEKKTIADEISHLQSRRSSLGIFAGKEKKEIDEKFAELNEKTEELEGRAQKLKNDLKGYTSKATVDAEIASNQKLLAALNYQIEERKSISTSKLSFEQALEELKNERVEKEFVKKYRNLYENDALKLYFAKVSDTIKFGNYLQDKDGRNETPILWRVLAKEDNKILVISEYALDCKQYNTSYKDITWETCSLRNWLNSTFFNNAFSAEEQAKIQNTEVTVDKNPNCNTNPGNDTTNKVFLLSIIEANKYLTSSEDRKCVPTAYAIAQGACYTNDGKATCCWWLRSPGNYRDDAPLVDYDGSIYYDGDYVSIDFVCVRPAMWINLSD